MTYYNAFFIAPKRQMHKMVAVKHKHKNNFKKQKVAKHRCEKFSCKTSQVSGNSKLQEYTDCTSFDNMNNWRLEFFKMYFAHLFVFVRRQKIRKWTWLSSSVLVVELQCNLEALRLGFLLIFPLRTIISEIRQRMSTIVADVWRIGATLSVDIDTKID